MERLVAKDAILEMVHKLAYAQDELDRALMTELVLPGQTVVFDISAHIGSYHPVEVTAETLMDMTMGALAGFTATQHLLASPIITLDSDDQPAKGHCKIQVCAYHCIQEEARPLESVTARGTWDLDVEKREARWVPVRIVVKRDVPLDNPNLYEVAKTRSVRRQEK